MAIAGLDPTLAGEILERLGFFSWGFLGPERTRALLGRAELQGTEAGTAIAVAFRYGEGEYDAPDWIWEGKAQGSEEGRQAMLGLARFARANWYAELLGRLAAAAKELHSHSAEAGLPSPSPKAWRRFANSPLPERRIALEAGLGRLGKNNILIAEASRSRPGSPQRSSAVLLGVLLSPPGIAFEAEPGKPAEKVDASSPTLMERSLGAKKLFPCGDCSQCAQACPTGAIDPLQGGFDREKCRQNWAGRKEHAPGLVEASMGDMLYGCDRCLEACPYFRIDEAAFTELGRLGPKLPATFFLNRSDAEIRSALKGTALGLGWISPAYFRERARKALLGQRLE
ncbi:MAG TPA: 4Fe-4S double cluster binding domain-containing protein [Rectinemataceae bacterium]